MRITGGQYGGRKINAPTGRDTRPTSDRLRLAIFNMLDSRFDFEGKRAADLFAGTGALGIEALSRGASYCDFWDMDRKAMSVLRDNLHGLDIPQSQYITHLGNALKIQPRPESSEPYDLIFLDPPYRKNLILPCLTALHDCHWLANDAYIIVESESHGQDLLSEASYIESIRIKNYGDTDLGLYQFKTPDE